MGGLYVLLAVATMGVTYGWQPDGSGGVEYLVQVTPQQLERVRESGEITSTIHPSVQGRVTRVVVRVGTGALPRINPIANDESPSSADMVNHSADDRLPVPTPQIMASSDRERVMKPDPQGGFDLPPSLAQAGGRGTNNDLRNDPRNSGQRTADPNAVPSFTNENTRSKEWFDLKTSQRPSTAATGSTPRQPEFVGPPSPFARSGSSTLDPRFQNRQGANSNANTATANTATANNASMGAGGATGYGSSSTFARPPGGINTASSSRLDRSSTQDPNGRSNELTYADNRLTLGGSRNGASSNAGYRSPADPNASRSAENLRYAAVPPTGSLRSPSSGFGLPESDPRNVDPRSVDPRGLDPRTLDPRTLDPRTLDPRTADPRTLD
ncbi:MAG: hypothetical protein HKN47_26955, partial [Pirellulaceae bacterium]|nr:hypothetical protein [Pirellulaceae bacterium]